MRCWKNHIVSPLAAHSNRFLWMAPRKISEDGKTSAGTGSAGSSGGSAASSSGWFIITLKPCWLFVGDPRTFTTKWPAAFVVSGIISEPSNRVSSLVAKFMVAFNLYRACREIKSGALPLTAAARIVPDLVPKTTSILKANLMVSCSPLP